MDELNNNPGQPNIPGQPNNPGQYITPNYNQNAVAPMTYDPDAPTRAKGGSQANGMIILLILIISGVVAYALQTFLGVPLSAYKADVTRLEVDIVAVRDRLDTIEAGALGDLDVAALDSALAGLTATIANMSDQSKTVSDLKTQLNAVITDVQALKDAPAPVTDLAPITAKIDALKVQVDKIIADGNGGSTYAVSVLPRVTATGIQIYTFSQIERTISFDFTFVPLTDVIVPGVSINDALLSLYTTAPVTLNTGVALIPIYDLYYAGGAWHIRTVTFTTPSTVVPAGDGSKLATYLVNSGSWTITVSPTDVAVVGGSGSGW